MRIPTYPTAAFDFELPESSIAQSPSDRRDASRLMVVDRASGRITHRTFADLVAQMDQHFLDHAGRR